MKRHVTVLFLFAFVGLISSGFRVPSSGNDFSNVSGVTIIKGHAVNSDRDKFWESVTFGVTGLNTGDYIVSYVEIFNKKGESIGIVDDFQSLSASYSRIGVMWYSIDLAQFDIKKDFTLEVHVQSTAWLIENGVSVMAETGQDPPPAPIDPDETILIVKYP